MDAAAVARYLDRIGFSADISDIANDLDTLTALQLAHLRATPFENLAIFCGRPVGTDDAATFDKIVVQRRGGWCFELNGAFAQLLEALGFRVRRLAAAVLLSGPTDVVDHMVLEVMLDRAYLVEVGFGDDAPITPLPLDARGPIATPLGPFELTASPRGTTLSQLIDGLPEPRYRFKRVDHAMRDFEPVSQRLQADPTMFWSTSPFATRLIDDQGTRLTLTRDTLKTRSGDHVEEQPVAATDWNRVLLDNFGIVEALTPAQLAKPS